MSRRLFASRNAWRILGASLAAAVLGSALALWPTLTVAVTVIACLIAFALRAPEYAFLIAILLFASEGSLKALLAHEGTPLTVSTDAVGAALLDLGVGASFLALVHHNPIVGLQRVWEGLPRTARIALALLAAWIAISVFQALAIGSLREGLAGFRLVQTYVVVGVVGGLLLGRMPRRILVLLLLCGLLVISGYAVLRVITGPSSVEHAYTVSRAGVETYGGVGRAAGSFSAAAGLASYLVPAAVFSFVLALTLPGSRLLASAVFMCAAVGIIGSYVRVGVVALVLGLLFAGGLLVAQSRWTRRRRLMLLGAVALAVIVGGVGVAIAARASSDLATRARVFVHPLADRSIQMRFTTWRQALEQARRHPLGTGIGSVGRASEDGSDRTVIVDNSYLAVLREQGWLAAPVFVGGVVLLLMSLARASLDRSRPFRPIAIGALSGALSFLVLGLAGEYIEQPGKVLAWLFLGLAGLEIGSVNPRDASRYVE
jgi:O-antigen ligase